MKCLVHDFLRLEGLSKGLGIKTIIRQFLAVSLKKAPVIFKGTIRQRFLVKGLHDSDSSGHHCSAKMLDDVKPIQHNSSLRK